MKQLSIAGFMTRNSGVGYHRIALPMSGLMYEKALLTNDISLLKKRMEDGLDILFYNRFIPNMPHTEIMELRERYGFKIVVDIDDFWELDPHHILYETYKRGMGQAIVDNIKIADLVTVTHNRLAVKVMGLNKPVFSIPNALPYDQGQFSIVPRPLLQNNFLTVGYVGGVTHEKDLEILRRPMARVAGDLQLKQGLQFRIFGYNETNEATKTVWGKMVSSLSNSGKLNTLVFGALPVEGYMQAYDELDLAIVPLLDTAFNAHKSNLKILEAGAKNLPVICSKVLPYWDGENIPGVLWVESQGDWYRHLKTFVKDPLAFREMGLDLGDWVRNNYSLARWTIVRRQLFEAIL